MSITFAGSRCVDERRRRRLAQEAEQETPAERRAPARPSAAPRRVVVQPRLPESPIESFLRPQMWVNVLLAVAGLAVCGGVVWLGDWVDRLHPHLSTAFGLHDGRLHRFLRALSFIAGAQLAYAVLWYRARSRKDFAGRYRVWHFVVPAWLVFGFATATEGHWFAAEWIRDRWSLAGDYSVSLCWMVPAGVVLLTLTRLLHVEMRGSRGSTICMWLGTLTAMANAVLLLGAESLPFDGHAAFLTERTAELLWPLSVFMAMVFYARHVIYVTNEPAPALEPAHTAMRQDAHPGWFARWQQRRREAASARQAAATARKAAQAAQREAAQAQREAEAQAAAERKAQAAKARQEAAKPKPAPQPVSKQSPRPEPVTATAEPPEPDEDDSSPAPQQKPSRPGSTEVAKSISTPLSSISDNSDDEDEEDDLQDSSGLSRKERRRLRKQQRQNAAR